MTAHAVVGASHAFQWAQLGIALLALFVAWRAFVISRDALQRSERESTRAGNRERLMWMHTALNQLQPLQEHALAPHENVYVDLHEWLKTCLVVAGARERLPMTAALAQRPLPQVSEREAMIEVVEQARKELLQALQQDGGRAYAGERLG
jgi:hypothetical protein